MVDRPVGQDAAGLLLLVAGGEILERVECESDVVDCCCCRALVGWDLLVAVVLHDDHSVVLFVPLDEAGLGVSKYLASTEEVEVPLDHGLELFRGCSNTEVADGGGTDEFLRGCHVEVLRDWAE